MKTNQPRYYFYSLIATHYKKRKLCCRRTRSYRNVIFNHRQIKLFNQLTFYKSSLATFIYKYVYIRLTLNLILASRCVRVKKRRFSKYCQDCKGAFYKSSITETWTSIFNRLVQRHDISILYFLKWHANCLMTSSHNLIT